MGKVYDFKCHFFKRRLLNGEENNFLFQTKKKKEMYQNIVKLK